MHCGNIKQPDDILHPVAIHFSDVPLKKQTKNPTSIFEQLFIVLHQGNQVCWTCSNSNSCTHTTLKCSGSEQQGVVWWSTPSHFLFIQSLKSIIWSYKVISPSQLLHTCNDIPTPHPFNLYLNRNMNAIGLPRTGYYWGWELSTIQIISAHSVVHFHYWTSMAFTA